jgi:hypothetical protein
MIRATRTADRETPSRNALALAIDASGGMLPTVGRLEAETAWKDAHFGAAIAVSTDGGTLAVGADEEDGGAPGVGGDPADDSVADSGAVYLLGRDGGTFALEAYTKARKPGQGNAFGCAVSLSGDGNALAAGACLEDGGATPSGGEPAATGSTPRSGAVYLY